MESKTQPALSNFVDLLLDAVFLVGTDGRILYVSAACERIFGYKPYEMVGRQMIGFVAPEDRERTQEEARHIMSGQSRIGFENRYIRKDGSLVDIMWSARWSDAGGLRIGVARDVSERKRAEERQAAVYAVSEAAHNATDLAALFREIERIVAKLVPVAGFVVATRDPKTKRIEFPRQAGMNPHGDLLLLEEPVARRYCAEVIRSGQPRLFPDDALAGAGGASWLAMPLVSRKDAIGVLLLNSRPGNCYSDKDKELLQFVSAQIATAIERRQLNDELLRAAQYDELTRLPNRRLFHDRMKSALARRRRKKNHMALLYVDIDGFKKVNDSFGHAAGDALLREVAQRLVHCVRETDTVARLGGDEFVVVLEEVSTPEDATAVAEKIRHAVCQPIDIGPRLLQARASIGVAFYPEHGKEAEALLKHADHAMYEDKRANSQVPA